MTRKPDTTEEQLPSKKQNEEGCEDDYDSEHDKLSKASTGPEHNDEIKNCGTGETRKSKRLRHHSAPQERSAGRFSSNTCQNSLKEGQRCASLPFSHSLCSCYPSGGMVGYFNECVFCKRGNSTDTSKSLGNYSLSLNEDDKNTKTVVCPQCARGIKTSQFIQGTKLSKLVKQLIKDNVYKLLLGLIAVFMLLVICNCLDMNHSICMSAYKHNNSFYYSKREERPLDIPFDRAVNIIRCDPKCSKKNFSIYNKLPMWFNGNLPAVTISAMHLTLTSTLVPTQRPNPVINWVSYLTPSHSMTGIPTPPLPRVPSILHDDALYEMTLHPSLSDCQNQCIGESESNNRATMLVDVSTSPFSVTERDCMAESGVLSDVEASVPDCVHDGHVVERHCTFCDVWVCSFCSRANFISTMGIENLMLQSIQAAQSFSNSRSFSRCGNLVSIRRNWWQRNMRHEYISAALELSPSVTSWESTYDSASDVADVLRSYRTLTSAISSVKSVLGRMTPPVTDTRYSITTDPVMDYLNNYCVSLHAYEPTVLEQCLLHKDALCALDGSGTAVRHIHALRTLCHSFQTQLLRVRRHLPLLRRRGHVVGDNEIPVSGQYHERNCAAQKGSSEDEQFYFLESEEESTDNSIDKKTGWRGWQFQSKTSSGFQSKTADSKDNTDESQTHTRVLPSTYRQTSASQTHMNPNCIETSPVYASGARPKTSTKRRKLKKAKGSM